MKRRLRFVDGILAERLPPRCHYTRPWQEPIATQLAPDCRIGDPPGTVGMPELEWLPPLIAHEHCIDCHRRIGPYPDAICSRCLAAVRSDEGWEPIA